MKDEWLGDFASCVCFGFGVLFFLDGLTRLAAMAAPYGVEPLVMHIIRNLAPLTVLAFSVVFGLYLAEGRK